MENIKSILTMVAFLIASISFFSPTLNAEVSGDCYLNTYSKPGSNEVCFICTTEQSSNPCTTNCGSVVCWTGPGEN